MKANLGSLHILNMLVNKNVICDDPKKARV